MPAAVAHIKEQLTKNGGVRVEDGQWDVADIHANKNLLTIQIRNLVLKGTADAVVVPYGTAPESYGLQARVFFEMKPPKFFDDGKLNGQPFGELLAGVAKSLYPPIVVATDLRDQWHVYYAAGGCIHKAVNAEAGRVITFIRRYIDAKMKRAKTKFVVDYSMIPAAYSGEAWKTIKESVPLPGIVEQLEVLDSFPPEEQFEEALDILHSWGSMYA